MSASRGRSPRARRRRRPGPEEPRASRAGRAGHPARAVWAREGRRSCAASLLSWHGRTERREPGSKSGARHVRRPGSPPNSLQKGQAKRAEHGAPAWLGRRDLAVPDARPRLGGSPLKAPPRLQMPIQGEDCQGRLERLGASGAVQSIQPSGVEDLEPPGFSVARAAGLGEPKQGSLSPRAAARWGRGLEDRQ